MLISIVDPIRAFDDKSCHVKSDFHAYHSSPLQSQRSDGTFKLSNDADDDRTAIE